MAMPSLLSRGRSSALSLAPGLVDTGFASLAGLGASLYAARVFDLAQLGLFSLYAVMFQLLGGVPARLILVPAQVAALDLPHERRTNMLARSLPPAVIAGLAAAPLVAVVMLLAPDAATADYVAFGVTTATMVMLSPLQDHVRFLFHMAGRSRSAALMSAVQFTVAATVIAALHFSELPVRWVPLLGLSIANACSLGFGVALARPARTDGEHWPGLRRLLRSGRVLLPAQVLPLAGTLGAGALVVRLASADALGAAEAARIVAAPVLVAGMGLAQVLSPRIMGAARAGRMTELASTARQFTAALLVVTAGYLLAFGWPHPLNLTEAVVPLAFTVTGLVAFRTLVSAAMVIGNMPGSALLGMEDNRGLLIAAVVTVAAQLLVAGALAATIEAHALPAAQLAGIVAGAAVMVPRIRGRGRARLPRQTAAV